MADSASVSSLILNGIVTTVELALFNETKNRSVLSASPASPSVKSADAAIEATAVPSSSLMVPVAVLRPNTTCVVVVEMVTEKVSSVSEVLSSVEATLMVCLVAPADIVSDTAEDSST